MKKSFLHTIGIVALIFFVASISGCDQNGDVLMPLSNYTINGTTFTGKASENTGSKAFELPCDNNNTIHVYYSKYLYDTMIAKYGDLYRSVDLNVVSNGRAGNLKWNECYIEVNTSATDTWLSTGTDNKKVSFYKKQGIEFDSNLWVRYVEFTDIAVQHWTSVPLTDVTKVSGKLMTKD